MNANQRSEARIFVAGSGDKPSSLRVFSNSDAAAIYAKAVSNGFWLGREILDNADAENVTEAR